MKTNKKLISSLIVIICIGLLVFAYINNRMSNKIEFTVDKVSIQDKESIIHLIKNNTTQLERLKNSSKLIIDDESPNFCEKTGEVITGKYINKDYGSLYISFVKDNNGAWSICKTSTGP